MHCVFMETTFTILFIAGFCDGNTVLLREHFYIKNEATWDSAKQKCKEWNSKLSRLLTEDDMEQVIKSVPVGFSVWINLKRPRYGLWKWPGGQIVDSEKWADGKPDSDSTHNCVYVRDGRWYNQICHKYYHFCCSKIFNRTLTVVQEMMSWENALVYCRSKYTDLSSLHSSYTKEKVINSTEVTTEFVWTGLRFLMGEWFWVNKDRMYNMVWSNAGHSQCPAMPLRCGALSVTERVFEARPCEEKLNFICYSQL